MLAEQCDPEVHKALTTNMTRFSEVATALMFAAEACVATTSNTRPRPGVSDTDEGLRARLRAARTTPQEREALVQAMWEHRHRIAQDKSISSAARVLGHPRGADGDSDV